MGVHALAARPRPRTYEDAPSPVAAAPAATKPAQERAPAAPAAAPKRAADAGPSAAQYRAAWSGAYQERAVRQQAEQLERGVVGKNTPGTLVELDPGKPGHGAVMTVHGANGSPTTMAAFHEPSYTRGRQLMTFAHDDMFRSQKNSAQDLAGSLRRWMTENPGKALEIDAHCQGARITLGAMDLLSRDGSLANRDIRLNLVTPPLQGLGRGTFAQLAPPGAGAIIPTVRPGKDMSPIGGYQRMLEGMSLPPNVHTRVFVADPATEDGFVDPEHARFQRVAARLDAHEEVATGADHMTAVPAAARRLLRR